MNKLIAPKAAPLITLGVTQLASVILALLGEFGLDLTAGQILAIMGAVDFIGLVLAGILWMTTVSKKEVVEKLLSPNGTVVAGEANELPAGTEIRTLSDGPPLQPAPPLDDLPTSETPGYE